MIIRASTLALGGVLLLTACGDGEPGPQVIGPATEVPSGTASSTPHPSGSTPSRSSSSPASSRPATTEGTTARERELFRALREYYAAVEQARVSRSTTELAGLSTKDCIGCNRNLSLVRNAAEKSWTLDIAPFRFSDIKLYGGGTASSAAVFALITTQGGTIRDSTGQVVESFPRQTVSQRTDFKKEGGRWLVAEITHYE